MKLCKSHVKKERYGRYFKKYLHNYRKNLYDYILFDKDIDKFP